MLHLTSKYIIDTKNIKYVIDILKKESRKKIKTKDRPFVILNVPLYKEQKIAKEALGYFSKIKYPKEKFFINIITTEREGKEKNSTYAIIKEYMDKCSDETNFNHIHYPNKIGGKPHQINYALSKVAIPNNQDVLVGIYDADSRPPLDTLEQLSYSFSRDKKAEVFQQFSLYFKDVSKLNYFSQSTALFQSRWTLSYELPYCIKNMKGESNMLLYTIGHGLFLNYNTFKELKGLPEDTHIEDLALGYRLSFLDKKIIPLYNFDNCDVPTKLKEFFLQNASWYAGEQNILKNKEYAEKIIHKKIPTRKFIIPFLKRKFSVLSWGLGSMIYFFVFLLNFYYFNPLLLLGLIAFGYLYSIRGMSLIIKNKQVLESVCSNFSNYNPGIISPYFVVPIRGLVNSVGPQYYYCRLMIEKLLFVKSPYSREK